MFVYFITRLPRMEGGTSYVGFHGGQATTTCDFTFHEYRIALIILIFIGPWRSVHIDDLRQSKDIISDIKALRNMTISQMFETKLNEPEGKSLTITSSYLFLAS